MACFINTVFSQKVLHKNVCHSIHYKSRLLCLTKNRQLLFDNERYPYLVHLINLRIFYHYPVQFLASQSFAFLNVYKTAVFLLMHLQAILDASAKDLQVTDCNQSNAHLMFLHFP